jgi:hypothetical protein
MSLVDKMIRAAKLDATLYDEVEKDPKATKEALLIVLIGGICNGIGSVGVVGAKGLITGLLFGIIGWLLWSVVIFLIGVKAFKHTSDMGELLRCLGFAYSPNVLSILGIIPGIGLLIRLIASIWVLIAFIVAVRQALDCDTGRAVLISILGFIAFLVVFGFFFSLSAGLKF